MNKVYLGDAVYASFDDYQVCLTTMDGETDDPTNIIYLNPSVVDSLIRYFDRIGMKVKGEK